jgi:hypothetical protein
LATSKSLRPVGGRVDSGGFPSSPEALSAWDRWCRALVERYKDRVNQWEVWNEPDGNHKGTAKVEAYIELYIRTATMVRELQPQGRIWALALTGGAGYDTYADAFLAGLNNLGKLGLCDAITVHGYPRNPDDTANIDRLRALVAKHGAKIEICQGETGAASQYQPDFALAKISWSETTQAKWDLRRLLAHRAKDVPMNLFTICDMHYTGANNQPGPDHLLRMNYKGLLGTNHDQSVARVKAVYPAVQTVFSIFDDSLIRISDFPFVSTALRGVALSGYRRERDGAQVVALWFNDAPPADANGVSLADVTLRAGKFTEPVLVDVRTSTVYALPKTVWTQDDKGAVFRALPIYDSPMLIAEKSALTLNSGK